MSAVMERSYGVEEVAKAFGVSSPLLHKYRLLGLLKSERAPHRGKRRIFSENEYRRAGALIVFRSLGFGIRELRRMKPVELRLFGLLQKMHEPQDKEAPELLRGLFTEELVVMGHETVKTKLTKAEREKLKKLHVEYVGFLKEALRRFESHERLLHNVWELKSVIGKLTALSPPD